MPQFLNALPVVSLTIAHDIAVVVSLRFAAV